MRRQSFALLLVGLAVPLSVEGHALDEYVQALKVGVAERHIDVHLAMTPGVNVANDVLRRIDVNGDEVLSVEEAEAYGRMVLADLSAQLDGESVALSLTRVAVPTAGELRSGTGIIRVDAAIEGAPRGGQHRLVVRNGHLPSLGVYLANALLPESRDVQIVKQSRDERQQTYALTYGIGGAIGRQGWWTLVAFTSLIVLIRARLLERSRLFFRDQDHRHSAG